MEHEHYTSTLPEEPKKYQCRSCGKMFKRDIRGVLCTACQARGVARTREILNKCNGIDERGQAIREEREKNRERRREI